MSFFTASNSDPLVELQHRVDIYVYLKTAYFLVSRSRKGAGTKHMRNTFGKSRIAYKVLCYHPRVIFRSHKLLDSSLKVGVAHLLILGSCE